MEVRYHMLRPEQIVTKREACPVVYIPIGTLEWHGVHNPVGSDTLQADGIAQACARKGGGLVFPPLYYGESRVESLMEADAADRDQIAQGMQLDVGLFDAGTYPYSAMEQALNYQKLLIHILAEAESLGFKVAVLVAGHYPLIDHARAAVVQYMQRAMNHGSRMIAWTFVDYQLVEHLYKQAGDHAAIWETSHMLALHPETVRLDLLPEKGKPLVGVMGQTYPQDATADYGQEIIDQAVAIAVKEVQHRLEHPQRYQGHGNALRQWLWQKSDKE